MKRSLVAAALCLSTTLFASMPVLAAKQMQVRNIDFGSITCGDFLQDASQSSSDDMAVVLMWIDGYLSGVSGDTVLNWKSFEKLTANFLSYCENKPNVKVLDAAEAVGIQ